MDAGLHSPILIAFVFAPLGVAATLLYLLLRKQGAGHDGRSDAAASLMACMIGAMPHARAEWGAAMLAELAAVSGTLNRLQFASGCLLVALFPPRAEQQSAKTERSPILGLLAVSLPLCALPFLYAMALVIDLIAGSAYSLSRWTDPNIAMVLVKLLLLATVGFLVAGIPFGFAGKWRRERIPRLSTWGMMMSVAMLGYFLTGMYLIAGGE
jgi:hypothetical protein